MSTRNIPNTLGVRKVPKSKYAQQIRLTILLNEIQSKYEHNAITNKLLIDATHPQPYLSYKYQQQNSK